MTAQTNHIFLLFIKVYLCNTPPSTILQFEVHKNTVEIVLKLFQISSFYKLRAAVILLPFHTSDTVANYKCYGQQNSRHVFLLYCSYICFSSQPVISADCLFLCFILFLRLCNLCEVSSAMCQTVLGDAIRCCTIRFTLGCKINHKYFRCCSMCRSLIKQVNS